MIKSLKIENFKSIKELDLECARINVFIGRPNSGKSNILESLSILSYTAFGENAGEESFKKFVRAEKGLDLFHKGILDSPIIINIDHDPERTLSLNYTKGSFYGSLKGNKQILSFSSGLHANLTPQTTFDSIKYYSFRPSFSFDRTEPGPLIPPHGRNFLATVLSSEDLRSFVTQFLKDFDLKLNPRQHESKVEVQKEIDDIVFSFPYTQVSDTVQSIIFYSVAMKSNSNATLVFEDPGIYAFPFYNKYLGERIALDASNQYFVCTHNPYFLLSLVSKASRNEIRVCVTYLKNNCTRVKVMDEGQVGELLDLNQDPFLSLDNYIDDRK